MKCNDLKERLSAYLDGELNSQETDAIFKHLDTCESCRQELDALESTSKLVGDHIDLQLASFQLDDLYSDVMTAVEADHKEQVTIKELFQENFITRFFKGVLSYSPTLASVAAILLLTFGVISKMDLQPPTTAQQETVSVESLEYSKFNAMIYKTKEKNKTVIWLFKQDSEDDIDDPI